MNSETEAMISVRLEEKPFSGSLYERLAKGSPEERTELIVRAIEEHPAHRLELPMQNGMRAQLEGIALNGVSLEHYGGDLSQLSCWDAVGQRARLQHAILTGADLRRATLAGVDMCEADLADALLGGANLEGARLEKASLQDADLVGTNLQRAVLGEANLAGAMLEEALLSDCSLRFANLEGAVLEDADLQSADLWGATLTRAILTGADLRGARLEETKFSHADLANTDLRDALLEKADLEGASLRDADLRDATLKGVNLRSADLGEARLQGVVLTKCDIAHIHLSGAWLDRTWLRREQLGGAVGEEVAGDYAGAAHAYLALEQNFRQLGDPDAASWAYGKRRCMQKLDAQQRAQIAFGERRWKSVIGDSIRFAGDQSVEWLCGYGESLYRVLASILVIYFLFIGIYWITGSVVRTDHHPASLFDLAIFTLLDMSSQVPAGLEHRSEAVLLLTGTQTLLSLFLVGLLGFVAGNRIHR